MYIWIFFCWPKGIEQSGRLEKDHRKEIYSCSVLILLLVSLYVPQLVSPTQKRKGGTDIKKLLYTDKGIQKALAIWAEFEKGKKEARREEGEVEERRDRELNWGRERMRREVQNVYASPSYHFSWSFLLSLFLGPSIIALGCVMS